MCKKLLDNRCGCGIVRGMDNGYESYDTRFGFQYGPAEVSRLCDHKRWGVYLAITTERETMELRVTRGGRISVYSHEKNVKRTGE